jgi:hypothetical protein
LDRDPKAVSPVLRYNTVIHGIIPQSASEKRVGLAIPLESQMRTKTLDDSTKASDPGSVTVSLPKLYKLQPELRSWLSWLAFLLQGGTVYGGSRTFCHTHISEHLLYGDSRAAMVVKVEPLLIAAYTDEMDCIVLLKFKSSLSKDYNLKLGTRLLTVNTYSDLRFGYARDIIPGEAALGRWGNMAPFIAEFLSDDMQTIEKRKAHIAEDEWTRVEKLAQRYLSNWGAAARDGRPIFCAVPTKLSAV